MKKVIILSLVLMASFHVAMPSEGALILTLDPGPTDLSSLLVGDTVDISVHLTGLNGMTLSSLGGGVEFPAANFGSPFNSAAGTIVSDASDLLLQELPGLMDSQFFAFLGSNIAADGEFFRFRITAIAPGSGTIAFDAFSLFADDDQLIPIFDIDSSPLAFSIQATSVAVPEMDSLTTAIVFLLAGGPFVAWRRRMRT